MPALVETHGAAQFTFVLRPSREGVVDTIDCFEIYGSELRFGPVAFVDVLERWDGDANWIPEARIPAARLSSQQEDPGMRNGRR